MSESSTPLEEAVSIVSRKDRRIVTVFLILIGLIGGVVTTYTAFASKAEGAIDDRITIKVTPQLSDHEKRLSVVETNSKETHDTVIEIRTLLTKQISQQAAVTP